MRFTLNPRRLAPFSFAVLVAIGCEETPTASTEVETGEVSTSRLRNMDLRQVDRFGLPAVNTAFTDASALKDAFNTAAPANDETAFLDDLVAVMMARYGLSELDATALADFVLPDIQPLGDLSGFPNGRQLDDDVLDVELSLIFAGGPAALQSDGVPANDVAFLPTFPYLAPPHLP